MTFQLLKMFSKKEEVLQEDFQTGNNIEGPYLSLSSSYYLLFTQNKERVLERQESKGVEETKGGTNTQELLEDGRWR